MTNTLRITDDSLSYLNTDPYLCQWVSIFYYIFWNIRNILRILKKFKPMVR